jgi:hypothetical protein
MHRRADLLDVSEGEGGSAVLRSEGGFEGGGALSEGEEDGVGG